MQKALRWYKNWKCSIKRTHLNVWLVKVNVVLKFFICHTPWGLSCLPMPCESLLVLSGVWGQHGHQRFCWWAAGYAKIHLAHGLLLLLFPKLATVRNFHPPPAFYSYPDRDAAHVTHPDRCKAPDSCFLRTPSPVLMPQDQAYTLRCTRENAQYQLLAIRSYLDQNLEKPLSAGYNFGPSTSGTSVEISSPPHPPQL